MFKCLIPLLPYMRRYSRAYVWGGIVAVLSSAVWVFFPHVIGIAIDDLNQGVTKKKILIYACLLVAIALAKGVFLFIRAGSS